MASLAARSNSRLLVQEAFSGGPSSRSQQQQGACLALPHRISQRPPPLEQVNRGPLEWGPLGLTPAAVAAVPFLLLQAPAAAAAAATAGAD